MGAMSNVTSGQSIATYTSSSNVIWGSLSSFFTSLFTPIIQNLLNMIVMIGLSVAGLIVANKMSITGAKEALNAAKGAGRAFGTYAGKVTARGTLKATSALARPRAAPRTGLGAAWRGSLPGRLMFKARTGAASGLAAAAGSKTLQTKPWGPTAPPGSGKFKRAGAAALGFAGGLAKAAFGGAVGGSGVFKKPGVKDWECQNCSNVAPPIVPPHILRSKKKPTRDCPDCHAPAAVADWTEV